jgi:phospholipid/cholesterol/gamma-HCH transport system substrate-binding protein
MPKPVIPKELKVGAFGVVALVLLIVGVNYLEGTYVLTRPVVYHAKYLHVDGLTPGCFVRLNGFNVGKVQAMKLRPESGIFDVAMEIYEKVDLPDDSKATIGPYDMFGTKCVILHLGKSRKILSPGDTLRDSLQLGIFDKLDGLLTPLGAKLQVILDDIAVLTQEVRRTVEDSNNRVNRIVKNVESVTANVNVLTADFRTTAAKINVLTDSLRLLAGEYKNNPQIHKILAHTAQITDSLSMATADLKKITASARQAADNIRLISARIQNEEGALGKMALDPQIVKNLADASKNLDALLVDLKANPRRYVHFSLFGKGNK